ncbi:TipAS antibiotic-recognition domain-containing protein [Streptomyces sp. NPDC090025]|uniref:TipAS antibiotic-recognition domain-containing protein n=1 Tax=Streptomyces sp. NPDC090025 TaxID=3365922 RepID=UPI003833CEC2
MEWSIQEIARKAGEKGDRWWRSLSAAEQQEFKDRQVAIARDYGQAARAGLAADSDEVQAITRRHYEWLSITTKPTKEYLVGLGQMYVDDPRFTKNYDRHGEGTAVLVRDAMAVFAERNL